MNDPVETAPELRSCLVVGSGLIGTSVALALSRRGVQVHLTDRDPRAARQAADLGAGTVDPPTAQVDLAVVAVSPSSTAEVVSGMLDGNVAATVVDPCGVRDREVREAVFGPGGGRGQRNNRGRAPREGGDRVPPTITMPRRHPSRYDGSLPPR